MKHPIGTILQPHANRYRVKEYLPSPSNGHGVYLLECIKFYCHEDLGDMNLCREEGDRLWVPSFFVDSMPVDSNPVSEVEAEYIIKPCPLCGGVSSPNSNWNYVWIDCDKCGARGPKFSRTNLKEAYISVIEAWNKRV